MRISLNRFHTLLAPVVNSIAAMIFESQTEKEPRKESLAKQCQNVQLVCIFLIVLKFSLVFLQVKPIGKVELLQMRSQSSPTLLPVYCLSCWFDKLAKKHLNSSLTCYHSLNHKIATELTNLSKQT